MRDSGAAMKKLYGYIRSMRFGMLLMGLIGALCVVATTSGKEEIYSSWYFILLFVTLGMNLMLCSVTRVFHMGVQKKALLHRAANSGTVIEVDDAQSWLKTHHFRKTDGGYIRGEVGLYGSFLTHASILLLMIFASCIFALSEKEELAICVGDAAELSDGTMLSVQEFSLEDENGMPEYTSELLAQLPDGTKVQGTVQVNHPLHIGKYKIYQQTYAYAAVLGIRTDVDATEEALKLDEPAFLSLDGENGIQYSQMFGNVEEENDEVRVSHGTEIINPAYEISIQENGTEQTGLVFPGTTIGVAGVYYTFYPPEAYPGLMVKTQPEIALWVLYLSFVLITAGLYLCLFLNTEAAQITLEGISLVGRKDISHQIEQYRTELNLQGLRH